MGTRRLVSLVRSPSSLARSSPTVPPRCVSTVAPMVSLSASPSSPTTVAPRPSVLVASSASSLMRTRRPPPLRFRLLPVLPAVRSTPCLPGCPQCPGCCQGSHSCHQEALRQARWRPAQDHDDEQAQLRSHRCLLCPLPRRALQRQASVRCSSVHPHQHCDRQQP